MADAITLTSDMKVYEEEFASGLHEGLALNSNIFNAASNGGITLETMTHPGNYIKRAFFKQVSSLITRQDITSTSAVDSKKLEQDEFAGVKLHRKIGPVQITPKSYKMAGLNMPEGWLIMGQQFSYRMLEAMANAAIIAAVAAVTGQTSLVKDITAEAVTTSNIKALNRAKMLWGDQASKLACWVMHSTPYTDLWEDGLAYTFDQIGGMLMRGGQAPALGAGLLITDNSNLTNTTPTPDQYYTLGLAAGAVKVSQSEPLEVAIERHTGYEQILYEIQGEFAITLEIAGFAYDYSSGGANPIDGTLGTTTNWDKKITDTKGLPLVCLQST